MANSITWDAEEYITKSHNGWWYFGLLIVTAGLSALAIWLQGWTFLALIIVCGASALETKWHNYKIEKECQKNIKL